MNGNCELISYFLELKTKEGIHFFSLSELDEFNKSSLEKAGIFLYFTKQLINLIKQSHIPCYEEMIM